MGSVGGCGSSTQSVRSRTCAGVWIQTTQFTEAALAHETGRALQDLGDFNESERQFRRSVVTRNQTAKRRTHALTVFYLADVQCAQGHLQDATTNWNLALDNLTVVASGRTRNAVKNIRTRLSSFGPPRVWVAEGGAPPCADVCREGSTARLG